MNSQPGRRWRWPTGRRTVQRWTAILIGLNIAWRCVRYGLGFPFWGDEAFVAINFLHRDFAGMIQPLEYGQVVPLLFMWAELAAARLFGMSEWALRLLPFLAGVTGIIMLWRFAGKVLDARSAMLAVGVFAASYYPVRHGTEVKQYSCDLMVSLVLTCLAWWVYQQPRAVGRWLALILAASAGLWLSYPAVFVAAGVGLFLTYRLLREPSRRMAWLWLAYGVCLGVSFFALFKLYAGPHAAAGWVPDSPVTHEIWAEGFPPTTKPWWLPLWFIQVHTGNIMAYPMGGPRGGSALTFILVVIGAAVSWRTRRNLLLLLLGPMPFAIVAAAMHRYPYGRSARLVQYMAPAFCLLAGVGLAAIIRRWVPRRSAPQAMQVAAVVLAGIALFGIILDVVKPYKVPGDYENRRILRELAANTGPSDLWISFNVPDAATQHADNIYLRGGHGARHRLYLHRLAPGPLLWAPPPNRIAYPDGGRIWLIVYKDNRAPFPEAALETYIHAIARVSGAPQRHAHTLDEDQWLEAYEFPKERSGR